MTDQEVAEELLEHELCCPRELFALINRALNRVGFHSRVTAIDEDLIEFTVVRDAPKQ